jgi:hypothetical protein
MGGDDNARDRFERRQLVPFNRNFVPLAVLANRRTTCRLKHRYATLGRSLQKQQVQFFPRQRPAKTLTNVGQAGPILLAAHENRRLSHRWPCQVGK